MSSKPRILRIINRFNLGGPTYNASYLTKYLEHDFETLFIGGQKMDSEESSLHITESLGLNPMVIEEMSRSFSPLNDYKAFRRILKIIDEFKPDIVHTHASKSGALGRLAARRKKVPVIVHTFHGHVFEHYFNPLISKSIIRSEKMFASMTSALVAISEKQRSDLVEKFGIAEKSKIHTIPLGFDLDRFKMDLDDKRGGFRKKFGIQEDEVVIGIIGRLVPIKNHHLFIDALCELKSKNIKFKATIIGGGEMQDVLQHYVDHKQLSDNVIFTSWIKDIDHAIAGVDIVALSSLSEGTPVSLIEAQAGAKPVVSTDVGGVADIMIDNKTGFITKSGDVDAFSIALEKLILDLNLREEMGRSGQTFSFENFAVQRLVSDMKKLYIDLLNR